MIPAGRPGVVRPVVARTALAWFQLIAALGVPSSTGASALDALDAFAEDDRRPRLLRGFVSQEARTFLARRDQGFSDEGLLFEAEVELGLTLGRGIRAYARPRALVDLAAADLWRIEPYEAYITFELPRSDFRFGQMVESWAVADTYNPIDLLNRRDLGVDLLDPPRLGEAGIRYRRFLRGGGTLGEPTLSLYLMPVFRRARWAPEGHRLAPSSTVAQFDENGGFTPSGTDRAFLAARFQGTLSTAWADADIQAVAAHGPDRSPSLAADAQGVLRPAYHGLRTVGFGARLVPNADVAGTFLASLTLKLEVAYRDPFAFDGAPVPAPEDHLTFVAGVDRTLYSVFGDRDEIALTLEVAGEVGAALSARRARPFGNDLVLRLAWQANDFARQSVELRAVIDLEQDESLFELTYARQLRGLDEALKGVVSLQVSRAPEQGSSPFALIPENTHLSVALRRDF